MNKDNKNTLVHPEKVSDYLENGWNLGGKKLNNDLSCYGLWVTNGEKQIRVLPDELQAYLDNGWTRGVNGKLGSSHEGSKLIHKGEKQIRVMPDELQTYLDNGWELGGKQLGPSADDSRRRGLWINNGERQMRVLSDELQTYLDNGWVRGYCKKAKENLSRAHQGQVAWNKGISPSSETRNKISKTISGSK